MYVGRFTISVYLSVKTRGLLLVEFIFKEGLKERKIASLKF